MNSKTATPQQDKECASTQTSSVPPKKEACDDASSATSGSAGDSVENLWFPRKVHLILKKEEFQHILSWLPNGQMFMIHNKEKFVQDILPVYFNTSKYKSFQRNLNLWGFRAVTNGHLRGAIHHRYFLQENVEACSLMKRVRIKKQQQTGTDTTSHMQHQRLLGIQPQGTNKINTGPFPSKPEGFSFMAPPPHLPSCAPGLPSTCLPGFSTATGQMNSVHANQDFTMRLLGALGGRQDGTISVLDEALKGALIEVAARSLVAASLSNI